jgi:hypothetical protein
MREGGAIVLPSFFAGDAKEAQSAASGKGLCLAKDVSGPSACNLPIAAQRRIGVKGMKDGKEIREEGGQGREEAGRQGEARHGRI